MRSVAENQPWEHSRTPEYGDEDTRLREQPQEPSQTELVSPGGNRYLVASDESERAADTVDRGAIFKILPQEQAEFFLRARANSDDDISRLSLPNERK